MNNNMLFSKAQYCLENTNIFWLKKGKPVERHPDM